MMKIEPEAGDAAAAENDTRIARRLFRWMFVNRRTGRITVAQWPNIPLAVFVLLSIARRLTGPLEQWATALRVASWIALSIWAVDELARGVNPFRRILGSVVLLAVVADLSVRGI
jgi:hypothetical protein